MGYTLCNVENSSLEGIRIIKQYCLEHCETCDECEMEKVCSLLEYAPCGWTLREVKHEKET